MLYAVAWVVPEMLPREEVVQAVEEGQGDAGTAAGYQGKGDIRGDAGGHVLW